MPPLLRNSLALFALIASLVVAATTVVHAAPAEGGIGIGLVNPPSDPDFPNWRTEIGGTVAPGDTLTRVVQVRNNGLITRTVVVTVDPASMRGGQFTFGEAGGGNSLTSWTKLDTQRISLAPGQAVPVTVVVDVPADAPTGDRSAVVWAQPVTGTGDGVVVETRVGVRMNLRVAPGAGTVADFAIDRVTAERDADGQAVVVADIRNTGGWAVEVGGELMLTDGPEGATVGPVYVDGAVVAAGAGGQVRFRIPNSADLPDGPWQARVDLASGPVARTHTASVTFPTPDTGGSGSLGSLGSSSLGSADSPLMWAGVAGVAAAAAGAVGWSVLQQQNTQPAR